MKWIRLISFCVAFFFVYPNSQAQTPPPLPEALRQDSIFWTALSHHPSTKYSQDPDNTYYTNDIIVIPLEALEEAIYNSVEGIQPSRYRLEEASQDAAEKTLFASAFSNDPMALGITAKLSLPNFIHTILFGGKIPFAGQEFIVAVNAREVPDLGETRRVEATRYFHVAADLKGTSPWIGTTPSFAMMRPSGPDSLSCCQHSNNKQGLFCGGGQPIPGGGCTDIACPIPMLPFDRFFNFDPSPQFTPPAGPGLDSTLPPFDFPSPWEHPTPRGSGQPTRNVHFLPSKDDISDPSSLISGTYSFSHSPITCGYCAQVTVTPDLCALTSVPDFGPTPGDICHPTKNDVPMICFAAGGMRPMECGGSTLNDHGHVPGCFGPGVSGPAGQFGAPTFPKTLDSGRCGADALLPDWCKRADTFGNHQCFESTQARSEYTDFINDVLGNCRDGSPPGGGVTCTDSGGCRELDGGAIQQCIECTDNGHCRESFKRSGRDPRLFEGSDNDAPSLCQEIDGRGSPPPTACPSPEDRADNTQPDLSDNISTTPAQPDQPSSETTITPTYSANTDRVTETSQEVPGPTLLADRHLDQAFFAPSFFNFPTNFPIYGDNADAPIITDAGSGLQSEQQGPRQIEDPVLLGSGALAITELDLAIPGPVRDLAFYRFYHSQSGKRGTLGSNWSHNFDVSLHIINATNAPSWASPFCRGGNELPNCVILQEGNGQNTIFYRDPGNSGQQVFLPQAGSTDTLVKLDEGWVIRDQYGGMKLFNSYGYLIEDRDRFGNGFRIEYEPVPFYTLYDRYCRLDSSPAWLGQPRYDARICDVMAYWFGDKTLPDIVSEGLATSRSDSLLGMTTSELSLPYDSGAFQEFLHDHSFHSQSLTDLSPGWPDWLGTRPIAKARAALQAYLELDILPELNTGQHRLRPIKVTDDVGRSINFEYYDDLLSTHTDSLFTYGLLKRITGPASTAVAFEYERPDLGSYPARLADNYLVNVYRADSIDPDFLPAPQNRYMEYEYAWSHLPSFPYQQVIDSYLDYFSAFMGCHIGGNTGASFQWKMDIASLCGSPTGGTHASSPDFARLPGNPCVEATARTDQLFSQISAKLTKQSESGLLMVETEYNLAPFDPDFGRVTTQRHGGMLQFSDAKLPQATFQYTSGQQTTSSNPIIPQSIYNLFQEETAPQLDCSLATDPRCWNEGSPPEHIAPTCGQKYDYSPQECSIAKMPDLLNELPGNASTTQYFQRPSAYDGQITTSPISCEQIGAAQLGDPLHNGLIATFDIDLIQGETYLKYLQDGRRRLQEDSLRVCRWASSTDRMGNTTYYGLNFRGQALLEATITHTNQLARLYRHFNADGNITYETDLHTTQSPPRFHSHQFDTFDHIQSDVLPYVHPGFWTRRNNRLRSEIKFAGPALTAQQDLHTIHLIGEVQEIAYEPLFNQPRSIRTGVILANEDDQFFEETIIDYDYQEFTWSLDPEQNPAAALLLALIGFGWEYSHQNIGADPEEPEWVLSNDFGTETDFLRDVQFPIHFYGEDLNGDANIGFYSDPDTDKPIIAGVPVRTTRRTLTTSESDRITRYAHAPHGQISQVISPSGGRLSFFYYKRDANNDFSDAFGPPQTLPTPSDYALTSTGFLAAITAQGWDDMEDGELHDLTPEMAQRRCSSFPGPFEYIFTADEGCGSNPAQKLSELGVDLNTQESLLYPQASTVSMTYNKMGHIDSKWTNDSGDLIHTDIDGRTHLRVLPNHLLIQTDYSAHGHPTTQTLISGKSLLSRHHFAHDISGNIVVIGEEIEEDGCSALFSELPQPVHHPIYISLIDIDDFEYCRLEIINRDYEGRPTQITRSDSATEVFLYDSFKRLMTRELHGSRPYQSTPIYFIESYFYDEDLPYTPPIKIQSGPASEPPKIEEWDRDLLGRIISHTNPRGENWEFDYDLRRNITSHRYIGNDYIPGSIFEETNIEYNGFGEVKSTIRNNEFGRNIKRLPDGRPFLIQETGSAPHFITSDAFGNILWIGDLEGNSQVRIPDLKRNRITGFITKASAQDPNDDLLTTSFYQLLDDNQLPISAARFSQGAQPRTTTITRDVLGRILNTTSEDGTQRSRAYNFIGDIVSDCEIDGPNSICTTYEYDRQGRLLSLLDPSSSETTFEYSDFGELMVRQRNSMAGPYERFEYDGFGRIQKIFDGDNNFRALHYDPDTGDLLIDEANTGGEIYYQYDGLGRLLEALRRNKLDSDYDFRYGTDFWRQLHTLNTFTYDSLGRVSEETIKIGGVELGSINRSSILASRRN